jgi:hypothetical protein
MGKVLVCMTSVPFGPFDTEMEVGLTEFGGGAGLVEGSPTSQSARRGKNGEGLDHIAAAGAAMTVDEKIGIMYRTGAGKADPLTGAPLEGSNLDPETGMTTDDFV